MKKKDNPTADSIVENTLEQLQWAVDSSKDQETGLTICIICLLKVLSNYIKVKKVYLLQRVLVTTLNNSIDELKTISIDELIDSVKHGAAGF